MHEQQEPPEFLEVPTELHLVKGANATLTCKVHGNPLPKITWMKDGHKLKKGKKLLLQLLKNMERLEVCSEIQLTDVSPSLSDGTYVIEAENQAGHVTHNVKIIGMICLAMCKQPIYY